MTIGQAARLQIVCIRRIELNASSWIAFYEPAK